MFVAKSIFFSAMVYLPAELPLHLPLQHPEPNTARPRDDGSPAFGSKQALR